jgi:tryptophan-rich sensory protein
MKELVIHVATPVVIAMAMNGLIYMKGWGGGYKNPMLPPGYIIGSIWIVILGLLGYAHYLTFPSAASVAIAITILYCLSYPFFTSGLQYNKSKLYNTLALLVSFSTAILVVVHDKNAFYYMVPLLAWASYVKLVE